VSAEATGYVWKNSPYRGVGFSLHLAMADVVNDAHGFEFWMAQKSLADKARTTRQTANSWISEAIEDGFISLLTDNSKSGRASCFRFEMPSVEPVWNPYGGVSTDDTLSGGGVSRADRGVSGEPTPGVSRADTELEEELKRTETSGASPSARRGLDDEGSRPDVDRLCELLASLIEANGSKRPTITKRWRQHCRLLLDNEKRSEKQIETIIRWSQPDEFWQTNIHSFPTLRHQFDKLRLRRNSEIEKRKGGTAQTEVNVGASWMRRTPKAG
jgi:hypothetical protein